MWTSVVPSSPDAKVPTSRSKHASVLHGPNLYLLGGRNGNVPLKDFWKYHIADNRWELIDAQGEGPGCLQEHSMVGYKDTIYVFGGEVGFSNGVETPLWKYNIARNEWRKFQAPKGVVTPKGRRSHTATVFQDSLYIYGGYQDLKGSTSELWAFHFESETWHLISQGGSECPSARHRHTAVLHDNGLWIFGGMTDLQEKSDLWRFDFVSRKWRSLKSKPGPGCLHSHCAVKFLSVMMLFGGERDGQALNEIWRFHFATEFWERLTLPCPNHPQPRVQTTAFILSQFTTRGAVHFMGLNEQDYFGTQPDPEKRNIKVVPVSDRNSPSAIKEESLYEEIDESQMVDYTFDEADNCLVEDNEDTPELKPRKMIYEKLPGLRKQQNSFQRMVEPGAQPVNNSFKAKMSNLSKMSAYSNYSIFSNESNESLNVTEEKSSCQTVTESMESPISPGSINFSLKKSQSMLSSSSSSKDSSTGSVIARDKSLQSFTQALIHTEPEEQNSTKKPEENIYEMVDKSMELLDLKEKNTPRSDSINTFQSYDCSSRSSTLSSVNNPVRLPLMGTRVLPPRNSRLVDLELDSGATSAYYSGDELSSLSGYESIDGSLKDKISSSKNNTTNNSSLQNMTSFSNPNYLCPDAKTMIEKKQQKNKFDETPVSQMSRDESHQNFAAALNSPAESLISDYQDFHARLNHDLVEMKPSQSLLAGHKSAVRITSFANVKMRPKPLTTPVLPSRKPRPVSSGTVQEMLKKPLPPVSANKAFSDDECQSPPLNADRTRQKMSMNSNKNQLNLLMYIIGGRQGQITVFNGPISLWKLDLTKTF